MTRSCAELDGPGRTWRFSSCPATPRPARRSPPEHWAAYLEPESALLLADDEVPASGARVTRRWRLARTTDGGVVLWMGRRKDAAPPRRSTGLRFDELTPPA